MNCNEARPLLEVHADGELDLAHRLLVEDHLRTCASCRARLESYESRRFAIRESLPRFQAPDVMIARIRSSLPRSPQPGVANISQPRADWFRHAGWAAALAAAGVIASLTTYRIGHAQGRSESLVARVVDNHVRSLLPGHLMDVVSTDQHTVKPWFAGRLPFSPTVIDLASSGFPLVGGRLEQVEGEPAAGLVYQRAQHRLNLLIWPATRGAITPGTASLDGYHVVSWTYSGFNYAAISDINEAELSRFTELFRNQLSP